MISSPQNEEMSSGNDELEAKLDAEAKQEASRIFAMHCKNFARIAKISQPQRKFRNPCEILAMHIFSLS